MSVGKIDFLPLDGEGGGRSLPDEYAGSVDIFSLDSPGRDRLRRRFFLLPLAERYIDGVVAFSLGSPARGAVNPLGLTEGFNYSSRHLMTY